jgi:hypothetical protein
MYNFVLLIFSILISFLFLSPFIKVLFVFNLVKKFNSNLSCIIFFKLVLILLIYNFFSWSFCKSFIGYKFYPSIQLYDVLFFII